MASYGIIHVNIDSLASIMRTLNQVQVDLDNQADNLQGISASLSSVLSGNAVHTFETNFTNWVQALTTIAEDISAAYSALDVLLIDLEAQTRKLNNIHFTS